MASSKFFRSLSSSSSSSDGVHSENNDDIGEISQTGIDAVNPTEDIAGELSGLTLPSQSIDNSQILLHALLEERYMNQAIQEHVHDGRRGAQRDEAAITQAARAKYQRACQILAQHSLITPGLEHDDLAGTRQKYRDGLDLISHIPTSGHRANIPIPLRRLLMEGDLGSASADRHGSLRLSRAHSEAAVVLDTLAPSHPILEPSRYLKEFDELGLLGKGGYGVVYRVRNRLDELDYAVKKVPISPARMARIRSRGKVELDELLREVRTMARLDHPNIVRYFNGWVEWSNVSGDPHRPSETSLLDTASLQSMRPEGSDAVLGAEDDRSLKRIVTQDDSYSAGILFESGHSKEVPTAEMSILHPSESHPSESGLDGISLSNTGPVLALHLQMGLYPLTLADYLSPQRAYTGEVPPLTHCFHLQPSLDVLLALVDGVEYLHSQNIVHRDLKPANIFIAAHENPRAMSGSVDLFLCSACRALGQAQPITLKVRIGDFGLVAALAQTETDPTTRIAPVGTEIYRPASVTSDASASLDIFALGIIAFELLWRFDTRMERHDTIQRLKTGVFPTRFSQRIGDASEQMERCIRDMLAHSGQHLDLQSLRQKLSAMRSNASWNSGCG